MVYRPGRRIPTGRKPYLLFTNGIGHESAGHLVQSTDEPRLTSCSTLSHHISLYRYPDLFMTCFSLGTETTLGTSLLTVKR
jgi:hypothetical protein